MEWVIWMASLLVGTILPFLFVLTVIVFVHEMGHFLVARWCNVAVDAFSIGFGPELLGWEDRRGTRWRIAAIPLGGYVKFSGDENAASQPDHEAVARMSEEERSKSFVLKPLWQRAAVVAAGPFANFVLAVAIFTVYFALAGRPAIEAKVSEVEPASPAAEAGFLPGDVIRAVDGDTIRDFSGVQRKVASAVGVEMEIVVERDGEMVTLLATPERRELTDPFGNAYTQGVLGVRRTAVDVTAERQSLGPLQAFSAGLDETAYIARRTVEVVGGIVIGTQSVEQLGGPIRVAQVSGEVAKISIAALFSLMAMLSISIGLINLLPIPMLDGGHLMFYAIEAVRGSPLPDKAQEVGFRIGLAMVLMLMAFVTYQDIVKATS